MSDLLDIKYQKLFSLSLIVTIDYLKKIIVPKNQQITKVALKTANQIIQEYNHV